MQFLHRHHILQNSSTSENFRILLFKWTSISQSSEVHTVAMLVLLMVGNREADSGYTGQQISHLLWNPILIALSTRSYHEPVESSPHAT
jgi:hypothetical protein